MSINISCKFLLCQKIDLEATQVCQWCYQKPFSKVFRGCLGNVSKFYKRTCSQLLALPRLWIENRNWSFRVKCWQRNLLLKFSTLYHERIIHYCWNQAKSVSKWLWEVGNDTEKRWGEGQGVERALFSSRARTMKFCGALLDFTSVPSFSMLWSKKIWDRMICH